MGQQNGSKLGKELVKAVYCHPAYLTSRKSTSCKMPGWMTQKLDARQSNKKLRYVDDTTLMAENEEELKSFLMRMTEESEKAGLKLNFTKLIMASGPSTSWQRDGKIQKQ